MTVQSNPAVALDLLLGALDKATKAGNLLRTCQQQGRAPTQEEIQAFIDDDDAARERLQSAIEDARLGDEEQPSKG